jgi:hypothetical protein
MAIDQRRTSARSPAIYDLRETGMAVAPAELAEAMRAGEGEEQRFELGPVELELTIVAAPDRRPVISGAQAAGER